MTTRTALLCLIILYTIQMIGCADMLDPQKAKDRDLAHVVEENLKTSVDLKDHFVSFSLIEPGKYKVVCKGLTDAQQAGNYGYNIAAVVDERNANKVRTGRSRFIIQGYQDGTKIFETNFGSGMLRPKVELFGPYADHEYSPTN